jgi:hypothetical protein
LKAVAKTKISELRAMFSTVEATPVGETVEATEEIVEAVDAAKFVEVQDEDGVILSIEPEVEVNASVAIMGEEGPEASPDRSYVLADGTVIAVEGGVIVDIQSAEVEEEAAKDIPEVEEEMSEEAVAPKTVIERTEVERKFQTEVEELKAEIKDLKESNAEFRTEVINTLELFGKEPSKEPAKKRKQNAFAKPDLTIEEKFAAIKKLNIKTKSK